MADPTKLERREVTLGRSNEQYVEILSGLEEGETIVMEMDAASSLMDMMVSAG